MATVNASSTAVVAQIREFVVANFLFGEGDSLQDHDSFLETGIVDSTGILELIGYLGTQFNISVEDHELVPENLDSVSRVADYVCRKLGK